jgi:hypothetical protein
MVCFDPECEWVQKLNTLTCTVYQVMDHLKISKTRFFFYYITKLNAGHTICNTQDTILIYLSQIYHNQGAQYSFIYSFIWHVQNLVS